MAGDAVMAGAAVPVGMAGATRAATGTVEIAAGIVRTAVSDAASIVVIAETGIVAIADAPNATSMAGAVATAMA